jgi:hypothetical protein
VRREHSAAALSSITEKIYKKISIGYEQWQAEDISGIDDPQTRRTYSPKFERIGSEVTVHSKFIAASLAIETTRRQTTEQSTDYKFDNNTFIISVVPKEGSPDGYTPEFDENFSSVTNLLNPETRYNIRLSVARNFLRWRKWFNGCCQNMLSSFYRFTSGEGNYDMISVMDVTSPDCMDDEYNGDALTENQNIEITDDINHLTNYYDFQAPLTWDEYLSIRANRKKAIGISQSDGNHIPLFIDELDYYPAKGNVKITGWSTEFMDIVVQEDGTASRDCMPVTDAEACEDAITDLIGEFLTTTTGACITA